MSTYAYVGVYYTMINNVPFSPLTGIYSIATTIQRKLPTTPDTRTNETFHPSILQQATPPGAVQVAIAQYPELLEHLMPLEEQLKQTWPYVPEVNGDGTHNTADSHDYQAVKATWAGGKRLSILDKAKEALMRRTRSEGSDEKVPTLARSADTTAVNSTTDWVKRWIEQSSFGDFAHEILGK